MAKRKGKKKNSIAARATIQELYECRDGGQIALRGFTYQLLYSCYLILSEEDVYTKFHLEGIEDIDQIKITAAKATTHIQLKYSTQRIDASFLKSVLKNFLEVYLLDPNRSFKVVYDFAIAKGNLSKLFNYCMDGESISYWNGVIEGIKADNPHWRWSGFQFDDFIAKLVFEKKDRDFLAAGIEEKLMELYEITTGNVILFANGIKVCCLEKMEHRESICRDEIDELIQGIKDDINRGTHNPAHKWIKRLNFEVECVATDLSYFEGKKPSIEDIVRKLPTKRAHLEKEIGESIQRNRVTVIKASSGQGKTTIALQVAYALQNEYSIYQLTWCNDPKELSNIVQYFSSRVRLGEKPLIILDNLGPEYGEWNRLAQMLQEEVSYHYRLLLTTREDDWYYYSGDLSNIRSLQVVTLTLNEQEAQSIFETLYKAKMLHPSVREWRPYWYQVADRKLLIEYIYLITHGEMLSERISNQLTQISNSDTGRVKCDILRKVCFADICGVKLLVSRLVALLENTHIDYGEIFKSMEHEFLIRVDTKGEYIEGLHPVRSQHIVDRLHEFVEMSTTALQITQIVDSSYIPKLFSYFPKLIVNKVDFYQRAVDILWDVTDLSCFVLALHGLFSGCTIQYFFNNQNAFNDANDHGGLVLLVSSLCPFTRWKEFDLSFNALEKVREVTPENANIRYLCELKESMPKFELKETDFYCLCAALHQKLRKCTSLERLIDIGSFSTIAYWLLNIDEAFNVVQEISLDLVWKGADKISADTLASIMYACYCGSKDHFTEFVEKNLDRITAYIKKATRSLKVYISTNSNEIHVEYILLLSNLKKANEESVARLKLVCKMLPIFETYCADSLKPAIKLLSGYSIPDDSHKTMPARNLIIMYHQEFVAIWSKTILSNYECGSIYEWLEKWLAIRRDIATVFEKDVICIYRLLAGKQLGSVAEEIDDISNDINRKLTREFRYPYEERPFDEEAQLPSEYSNVKSKYFGSISNFLNQFAGFLRRDNDKKRLAIVNLRMAQSELNKMQVLFMNISNKHEILQPQHSELCLVEIQQLQNLLVACLYYNVHQVDRYFSKYQIRAWYEEDYKSEMDRAKLALSELAATYQAIFPNKYYYTEILSSYPIIINNIDTKEGEKISELFYHSIPFANLSFDYLVLLFRNEHEEILPDVLRIPRDFLVKLKETIETADSTPIESLSNPYPEKIAPIILDCFEQKYELSIPTSSEYDGIDKIAELLWAFSKSREELADEKDEEYRISIEEKYESEIKHHLEMIGGRIPKSNYEEIVQLCSEVFSGEKFKDESMDRFFEKLINWHSAISAQ